MLERKIFQRSPPRPVPLRSSEWCAGLPNLSPTNAERVRLANLMYDFVFEALLWGAANKVFISIENPLRSHFWAYLAWKFGCIKPQLSYNGLHRVDFDNCMHGGKRLKSTRFLCTDRFLQSLARTWDASHAHEPYSLTLVDGVWTFSTAAEGAYPALFLQTVCHHSWQALSGDTSPSSSCARLSLVPELHVIKLQSPPTDLDGCKVFEPTDSTGEGAQSSLCKVRFYATPRQFVSKAKALNHPMDADNPVSDWVKRAIFSMMTVDSASLALQRATRLKQILTWKSQLEKDEQKLTNSLPAHSKVIMEGKQVLLMQRRL